MADTNIWTELSKMDWRSKKRRYFMWKHKLQTTKKDYGQYTEEEFLKYIGSKEDLFIYMSKWESSAEYKRLLFLLKEDEFSTDLLETYEKVKELAKSGDSQAIKNMIMLQKEIKKYRHDIDKFSAIEDVKEEDDGLEI